MRLWIRRPGQGIGILMKKTVTIIALILICVVLSLIICLNSFGSKDDCIPPVTTFAFPVASTMHPDFERNELPPPSEWELQVNVSPAYAQLRALVNRNGNEIWILVNKEIVRYLPELKIIKAYTTISGIEAYPTALFVSSDGTLWGIDHLSSDYPGEYLPVLSRYNDKNDSFEFVDDIVGDIGKQMSTEFSPPIIEDHNGLLWMILEDENGSALYSFDPISLIAERHFYSPDGETIRSLAITHDGTIWIGGSQLYRYALATRELMNNFGSLSWNIIMPGGENTNIENLLVDNDGNLWLDDQGWLDFSDHTRPVWHKIVRSPLFIYDYISPEDQYGWLRPDSVFQDSNNIYWFTSSGGIVNLDAQKGSWCKIISEKSPVIEDDQGNLWIAVLGNLYKKTNKD